MSTALRIKAKWAAATVSRAAAFAPQNNTLSGATPGMASGQVYSGASVSDTSADFLGDWRSADAWQRFDLWRVRNRSRQIANGNPMAIAYLRNMRNNVLGHKGMHFKSMVKSSEAFGDSQTGRLDTGANAIIAENFKEQGKQANYTTRKINSRRGTDELLLNKLITDGEFIMRKIRGFNNPYKFAWQSVNPDYLDHNLNRVEDGRDHEGKRVAEPGNITKMGVELDKDYKFPVAYWFLVRRPNDYFYNYATLSEHRYVRVPAEEVIHCYVQFIDEEQTRGWPWMFAAVVNLFRADKFQEAALINATIGAMKTTYFKKEYPEGYEALPGSLDSKDGERIVRPINAGEGEELPYGVTPVPVDMRYPDAELGPFMQAMNLATAMTFGTSYATTTGDLSQANFVSSRLGQEAEHEFYMAVQEFFIEKWKIPAFDEELYRAILSGRVNLPLSKFEKFNCPQFTGRRWDFVQPVDQWRANEIALRLRAKSLTAIIEQAGGDRDEIFEQIKRDNQDLGAQETPIIFQGVAPDTEDAEPGEPPKPGKKDEKKPLPPEKK